MSWKRKKTCWSMTAQGKWPNKQTVVQKIYFKKSEHAHKLEKLTLLNFIENSYSLETLHSRSSLPACKSQVACGLAIKQERTSEVVQFSHPGLSL